MKELVNKMDWLGLSCQERALALGCEAIKSNSSLYFMLFKYAGNDFLIRNYLLDISDDAYYEYLCKLMGINIELRIERSEKIREVILKERPDDERIVLVINCINDVRSRMYQKESHPHFVLLESVCRENDTVKIMDEDFSKEYWKAKNSRDGVSYIESELPVSEMISKCRDVNRFSKMNTNEDICAYYVLKKTDNMEYSPESVLEKFNDQMKEYLRRVDEIKRYCLETFERFTSQIDYVKDMIISEIKSKLEIHSDEEAEMLEDECYLFREYSSWLAYPYEAKIALAHHQFLYLHSVVFSDLNQNLGETGEKLQELLKGYENLKTQIAYAVLSKDAKECEDCISAFKKLLELEEIYFKELYKFEA